MNFSDNPQIELAYQYVRNTDKNIFLTGKAGTGKTTFLHTIKNEGLKRMAIVAPTGVAAINAGGMTIHSLFQLPFGLWLPDAPREESTQRKFTTEKIRLLRSLDLLVIDEISMVRADLLDNIDEVLRRYRNNYRPFGGVQLLMIGDLHQLPPVVKDDEWALLRNHYKTPYFFGSIALQKTNPVAIELKHIYRQSDSIFIDLLNKVRDNQIDQECLDALNSRYQPDFQPPSDQAYITLTAHNQTANDTNAEKLLQLSTKTKQFKAEVSGDFPPKSYPTDELLELKIGAQVMFVKNDIGPEKRFYNGKIGKILEISDEEIKVSCPGESVPIFVNRMDWKNINYVLDETSKEMKEEEKGYFIQFPLKLAWAITIHKSQGLTFERAIIDAQAAFAHGQVYVALSRCKSFEGIVLRSRITASSVKTDSVVKSYSDETEKNAPTEEQLFESKRQFQHLKLTELFDFKYLRRQLENSIRLFVENENSLGTRYANQVRICADLHDEKIGAIALKFIPQLNYYALQPGLIEENEEVQARLKKAAVYFLEQLLLLDKELKKVQITTENKALHKTATDQWIKVRKEAFIKMKAFDACQYGFSSQAHLRAVTNSELDFSTGQAPKPKPPAPVEESKHSPELYFALSEWRDSIAADYDETPSTVLPHKALQNIIKDLPVDEQHLNAVTGVPKATIEVFSKELLEIVRTFCLKYQLRGNVRALEPKPIKLPKENSKLISLEMFKAGKTIDEIASERGFVPGTIFGHLVHYVSTGDVDIKTLVPENRIEKIVEVLEKHPTNSSAEVKQRVPEDYTFDEIKAVMNFMKAKDKE